MKKFKVLFVFWLFIVLLPNFISAQPVVTENQDGWLTYWTNYLWYDGSGTAADSVTMKNNQWNLDPVDTSQIFYQCGKPWPNYFEGNVVDFIWYWEVRTSSHHDQGNLQEMITPDSVEIIASLKQLYHRLGISDSNITSRIAVVFYNGNTHASVSCTEYDLSLSKKKFVWTPGPYDSTDGLHRFTAMLIRVRVFGDTAYMGNDVEIFDMKMFKDGELILHDSFNPVITDVEEESIPTSIELSQNYPNPFNPTTKISFSLPKAGNVNLKVYDILGREVATLVNEEKPAGNYEVAFNGSNLASGTYIYVLQAGNTNISKKMLLVK